MSPSRQAVNEADDTDVHENIAQDGPPDLDSSESEDRQPSQTLDPERGTVRPLRPPLSCSVLLIF